MKTFCFLFALLVSASAFAQDYWTKIPAYTTECYTDNDPWRQKVDALSDELNKKIEEQGNKDKARFENMSDAEKQKLQMEMATKYMTMSPQEIMDMQNASMKQLEMQQAASDAGTPIMNRYNELEQAYRDERGRELGALEEEARKLPDGEGTPDWAIKKGEELAKQHTAKYQVLCAKYFTGSDALFKKWLAEYKQYVIDYTIPLNKANYAAAMQQFGIMGAETPAAEWEGIKEYLKYYRSAFSLREQYPHL